MKKCLLAVSASILGLLGCQVVPTKTTESRQMDFSEVVAKSQKPLVLTENTQILDVRSSFDYGLIHVLNSQNFSWESLVENRGSGEVMRDLRKTAQRLALRGLEPSVPVVIVGYGPKGNGEEGRLAWNLLYLGFKDVQVSGIEVFRKQMSSQPSHPARNVAPWEIQPKTSMEVSAQEFLAWANNPKAAKEKRIFILDVRSEAEYLKSKYPELQAINIEWKNFYSRDGRPSVEIFKNLRSLGVEKSDRVIVIDDNGVRSASSAYALLALGFTHVQIYFNKGEHI